MKSIRVHLNERSYDIRFGSMTGGLPAALVQLGFQKSRVLVVTSRAVARAGHAGRLVRALEKKGFRPVIETLPDGESGKNLKSVERLYRQGFRAGLDRKSCVVALGGGVVTDLAGFLAATYMRGIPLVSVPTTLLGMVDASIGGKTGVDMPEGKNLVGAFWQPRLVWIDAGVLKTLPEREWNTGMAEIIKYGIIRSRTFFDWLEGKLARRPRVSRWAPADVLRAIHTSAAIKAEVVSGDERETPLAGGREILNFGHTSGHALEAATGYRSLTHGEAISIGMCLAGRLALLRGSWLPGEQRRMERVFHAAGLPVRFPALSSKQSKVFWGSLSRDKKNVDGLLRFVLPVKMGQVRVMSGINPTEIRQAMR